MTARPSVAALEAPASCDHPIGRHIPKSVAREMLRALGVVTCPRCHQIRRIVARTRVLEP